MKYYFYPRPVSAFGYCRCLRLSVRPSVCPSVTKFVCSITHYPFKQGSPNLDHRCKRPWLRSLLFFGVDWPWPSRSNLTSKSKFTPVWACEFVRTISHHWLQSGFPNLDQKCILRSLLILGLIAWAWSSVSFLISNLLFSTKLCVSYSFASDYIYLVRPLPGNVPHSTWHRTYTDSHARGQGRAMDRDTV